MRPYVCTDWHTCTVYCRKVAISNVLQKLKQVTAMVYIAVTCLSFTIYYHPVNQCLMFLKNWTGLMDWITGLNWWTELLDWWTELLDWTTGLHWWTGLLDWTHRLNYWAGLICSYHITSGQSVHNIPRPRVVVTSNKKFWTLLGYNDAKVPASPRNSTWFTRPFLLVRGCMGSGDKTKVVVTSNKKHSIDKITMNMFVFDYLGAIMLVKMASNLPYKMSHKIHYWARYSCS